MRKLYYFIIMILLSFFTSCEKFPEDKIIGSYGIDKFALRDSLVQVVVYSQLKVLSDKTFELTQPNGNEKLTGTWKLLDSKSKSEARIQFILFNKEIIGTLKGTIFSFEYPNDFYSGKYESVLFVKLRS